ncbi:MAG TPA: VWA domain-containing protein [Terracidiphilus sp.]|jgi:VWFA-related protein
MNQLPDQSRLLVLALLFCLPICSGAQEPNGATTPEGVPVIKATSRLVVLDLVVTDGTGQLRNKLNRDDFRITEDGAPQTISSFEKPSDHPVPSGAMINSTNDLEHLAPDAPVNIIVLDEINTGFQDMAFARYALTKYLNAQPEQISAPTLLVAVNFDKTGLTVIRDYTQNREDILRALDHHLARYPWNLEKGESPYLTMAKSLGALEQVTEAAKGHPGHKNIVWVGKGFPTINVSNVSLPPKSVDELNYAVRKLINMLTYSRITLYPVDPTMLTVPQVTLSDAGSLLQAAQNSPDTFPPQDPLNSVISLTGLAKATGGKSFYSRNDVDKEIAECVRDGVNYYTIAYRPTNSSDAGKPYRRINVELTTPGLHAFYRDGYFAANRDSTNGPETPAADEKVGAAYDVLAAEESAMVYTGLTISVAPKPGVPNMYVLEVPEGQLAWTAVGDAESSELMVAAAAVNNKSKVLVQHTEKITARRKSTETPDPNAVLRIEIALSPVVNTSRLRFIVRSDGNGRVGTADIPDQNAAKEIR